jgi:hypothetical protein
MIIRLILFLAGAVAGAFAGELRLLLVDESGQPFAAARTTVVFTTPELGAEQVRSGVSDPAGVFVARGTSEKQDETDDQGRRWAWRRICR